MDDAARLLALREIEMLKARYFRTMDGKDWAGLQAVFTPDLIADFRDSAPERNEALLIHGAEPYVAMLAPTLANVTTVHHGHMPEIRLEDADHAQGIWAMEDWVWPDASSTLPYRWLHGWGHYHERYRHVAGEWKIAAIRLSRLRVEHG
ncbi:nuclear transport factor 2 family protein [Sphingobium estronivorans]|uniref:nuclear transport factor 2 family protein n=1 Tax=Sphingobium estronivorans TaxID=1577690 RepID=UPI00123A4271|nr:nuclear transport factor 2 family protein [Sphingobium estronivorans]